MKYLPSRDGVCEKPRILLGVKGIATAAHD